MIFKTNLKVPLCDKELKIDSASEFWRVPDNVMEVTEVIRRCMNPLELTLSYDRRFVETNFHRGNEFWKWRNKDPKAEPFDYEFQYKELALKEGPTSWHLDGGEIIFLGATPYNTELKVRNKLVFLEDGVIYAINKTTYHRTPCTPRKIMRTFYRATFFSEHARDRFNKLVTDTIDDEGVLQLT